MIAFNKMELSQVSFNEKYNLPKLNPDISTASGVLIFSITKVADKSNKTIVDCYMVNKKKWFCAENPKWFNTHDLLVRRNFTSHILFSCSGETLILCLWARYMRHSVPFYGRWGWARILFQGHFLIPTLQQLIAQSKTNREENYAANVWL